MNSVAWGAAGVGAGSCNVGANRPVIDPCVQAAERGLGSGDGRVQGDVGNHGAWRNAARCFPWRGAVMSDGFTNAKIKQLTESGKLNLSSME